MNKRYVVGKIVFYDIMYGIKLYGIKLYGFFGGVRLFKICWWFMGLLWWVILVFVLVGFIFLVFNKVFLFDRLVNDIIKFFIFIWIRII